MTAALLKKGLTLTVVAIVTGLVGCTTVGPSVSLSGPAGPYIIGEPPITLTATGSPGSAAGLWTYSFSASPACGTFSPATIGPTNLTTVTTSFTPTTEAHNCVLTVTLTTASGKKATASITRAVGVRPTVVSTVPANNATNVLVTSEVSVTFSHDMDLGSLILTCTGEGPIGGPLGTCNMTISGPTGSGAGPYTWTVGDPDATPSTNLQYDRTYRLQVTGRRAPSFLIPMAAPYVWAFDTEPPPALPGTIIINKTAAGGDDTFNFTATGTGLPPSFTITTSGGSGSQTFTGLAPGTYTVTEVLPPPPANWSFTSLTCSAGGVVGPPNTATITITAAGETVTCTYTNTYTPPIVACPATPVTPEAEPANNLPGSQTLTLTPGNPASAGFTARVSGTLPTGDVDQYSFSVGAGTWLVFAYVRTDQASGSSPDDTVMAIGTAPFTTARSAGCTGWAPAPLECDDEDGGQWAPTPADTYDPSSIAARSITGPATVYIAVAEWDGSYSILSPGYRLYIAVVPTTEVVSESEPANNTAAGAPEITKCPYVVSGTQATGDIDYVRFNIDVTTKSVWASMGWAVTGVLNAQLDLARVSPLTDIPWLNATPPQFGGASGNCDSSGVTGTPAPPSESCSKDPGYAPGDTWPATGYYAAGPAAPVSVTGTPSYHFLIVVWP